MNPYLLTITFLTLMSIITSSETARYFTSTISGAFFEQYAHKAAAKDELHVYSLLEEFKDSTPNAGTKEEKKEDRQVSATKPKKVVVQRSTPLRFNRARPPNNSRLNMRQVLFEDRPPNAPGDFSFYETAARLMRKLYGNADFFKDVPNAEYRILDRLISLRDKTIGFHFPDELGTLEMDAPELQHIYYLMLTGTGSSPALVNYLTFDTPTTRSQARKINFMFASEELLDVIIQNPVVVQEGLKLREALWEEITKQEAERLSRTKNDCKTRTDFKKELKAALTNIFLHAGLNADAYLNVFDLTLGRAGNTILYEDAVSQKTLREKYIPKIRTPKK